MKALVAALALIPLTLDSTAAVILGGLISSTLLDIIVTPVVFYRYGKKALETYINHQRKNKDDFTPIQ